jgi:hypothetical protein
MCNSVVYGRNWAVILSIIGFLDLFNRPVFEELENMTFWKVDLFPSSNVGEDTYSVGSLRQS